MFLPKTVRLKFVPWLVTTAAIGFLPFGLAASAQAQTVIYNGRTIVTEDYERYDGGDDDYRYDSPYDPYGRYGRYERYDRYDRYDNDNYADRDDHYDNGGRYGRYGRYDRYDHDDRYDNGGRYGRYDSRYDRYDHDDHDGFSHRRGVTVIQERPYTGQSNPACLSFENLRIACRR
jgi:hypothetical protein